MQTEGDDTHSRYVAPHIQGAERAHALIQAAAPGKAVQHELDVRRDVEVAKSWINLLEPVGDETRESPAVDGVDTTLVEVHRDLEGTNQLDHHDGLRDRLRGRDSCVRRERGDPQPAVLVRNEHVEGVAASLLVDVGLARGGLDAEPGEREGALDEHVVLLGDVGGLVDARKLNHAKCDGVEGRGIDGVLTVSWRWAS